MSHFIAIVQLQTQTRALKECNLETTHKGDNSNYTKNSIFTPY